MTDITVLALTVMSVTTQIKTIVFVSCHPRKTENITKQEDEVSNTFE
jgi:hypothetical protein